MKIKSSLITLKEMTNKDFSFNIPIYQRLYVWKEEQVNTLLEDIKGAFIDEKEIFYLGGTLVVENKSLKNYKLYDLIDGQQRLTTLWMIAIIFRGEMNNFIKNNADLNRISFSIRKDVNDLFENYIKDESANENNDNIVNANIENAFSLIIKHKNEFGVDHGRDAENLSEFIYNKVKLVLTEVHKDTDLNKLFEVINNRGVQLQHHEILKARLLGKLNSKDQQNYGYLWDACSYMDSYVEENIKNITNKQFHELLHGLLDEDETQGISEKLSKPNEILKLLIWMKRAKINH